ncbi:MAG: DUF4432 family protein, partial [Fimbriimonadales bacterium]
TDVRPRDEASAKQAGLVGRFGRLDPASTEAVFEHEVTPDSGGWASATVVNESAGLRLVLAWATDGLPRFHQWVSRKPGWYVLGLEPANCSVMGRAFDRARGNLPLLTAGTRRTTQIKLEIGDI